MESRCCAPWKKQVPEGGTSINIPPTLPWPMQPCSFLRERKCRLIQGPDLSPGREESPAMGAGLFTVEIPGGLHCTV
ncbi:hypothetical protein Q8A67_002692 [Cirrhinus molitorella]|uniref:Uncharacterized protein n=1 Tax=Cirrhinus molitorella TaxID=172907 RepID=A0AA88Q4C0_9TELE|nr:hypothetical protein Q8A67_002692 [Cirrhinus molitorella]